MKQSYVISENGLAFIKTNLRELGSFFSVQFIKKDGTRRNMVARFSVRKHLKGGPNHTNPDHWTVWSPKDGYRSIDPSRIEVVSYNKMSLIVNR